jgi:hypothetical protein
MRSVEILSGVYSARIDAVEALLAAADRRVTNATDLRTLATLLDDLTTRYGDAKIAVAYSAFADLVRTLAMLVDWRAAVLDAAVDPDRFLRSALERYRAWHEEFAEREEAAALAEAASPIEDLSGIESVGPLCKAVGSTPLPIAVSAPEPKRRILRPEELGEDEQSPPPAELTVAFVRFNIDGAPASQTEFLTPQETHDLQIEVRVSRWPEQAETLRLTPVTFEARTTYDFPQFRFPRPGGEPPYHLIQRGRALLHAKQSLRAQPFEFKYAAEFEPQMAEQPVAVVGHRTLRIESIDLQRAPITGYQGIDRRIVEIRDALRRQPLVTADDVANALTILSAVSNLAGQAAQDNLFPGPLDEPAFQSFLRRELRRRPEIGSKLEEHPRAAGGITDLSFERIRIELKSVNEQRLRLADCQRFVGQSASYVTGSGKRIGLLCVLDGSPKAEPAFPPEDGIGVLKTEDGAVAIVAVLIQGNLARPSDLSRAACSTGAKANKPGRRKPARPNSAGL